MSTQVVRIGHTIWKRYTGEELKISLREQYEPTGSSGRADALAYLSGVVGRQIMKANGVLAFNGILLAAMRLSSHLTQEPSPWHFGATLCSVIACLGMLALLRVDWAAAGSYETYAREFEHTLNLCGLRSSLINVALVLSGGSLTLHAVGLALQQG
jgi:hypothetical protein